MAAPAPFFVSKFIRRLDARRRLRLPAPWRIWMVRSWLLYSPELLGHGCPDCRTLRLVPVTKRLTASILAALKITGGRALTIDAALAALQAVARRRGLDPAVVTLHRTDDRAIHLKLTAAQFAWLGLRNRSLALTGVVTGIDLWSAAEHARWERTTVRAASATRRAPRH